MSVIVLGMEMPSGCQHCGFSDDESRYCKAAKEYIPMLSKPEFCPLRPMPEKHGRLIDGTSLLDQVLEIRDEEVERNGKESIGFILTTMMEAMVTAQDTIVEAEGD